MEFLTFAFLAVLIGMRHGVDGDHVAAIADMVGSEKKRRKQVSLGIMYAFGHGLIVLIIGLLSIYIGLKLPQSTLMLLEMLVGLTLIVLGCFILYSIFHQKTDYEYKSRLKILYDFISKKVNRKKENGKNYSPVTFGIIGAFIIGVIHGIGVESPTQIAVLTNAVGVNNFTAAMMQLGLFVLGLLLSTVGITFCLSWGFMKARFKRKLFLVLGSITGIYSLGLGCLMLVEIVKGGA